MTNELDAQLRKIFAKLFPVDPADLADDARRGELEGWDSLGILALMAALDEKFDINLNEDDIGKLTTVGSIIDLLRANKVLDA